MREWISKALSEHISIMRMKYFLASLAFFSIVGWGPFFFIHPTNKEPVGSQGWYTREIQIIDQQATNIDPEVVRLSLEAYVKAREEGLDNKEMVTIIDYSKPSTERRLWVVDIKNQRVLFNTWVTHGKNSGTVKATSFSNQPGSLKSSLGVFLTTNKSYVGENGYSLRVQGLEQGVNSNAYKRAIVFHGAWYATPEVAEKYGVLGRSWGCPAVSDKLVKPLIDTIKGSTLVFAYYPDRYWLKHSAFLAG